MGSHQEEMAGLRSLVGRGSGADSESAEQRGREKGRGKGGRARPWRRRAAVGRRGLNRGGNGAPKSGPWGYSAGLSFKNQFQTDSNHI
jgi:hypothetical protein